MSLKEQIDTDIKKAMLGKNKDELRALRGIKSMILLAETEKGSAGKLDTATEMQLLTKAAKQRRESLEIYKEQGRDDLAGIEEDELKIIERYLPEPISEEELNSEIKKIIEQTGAKSLAEMGKVMGLATKALAGKADGKTIADAVKKNLTS
jgi:hypothetical protein